MEFRLPEIAEGVFEAEVIAWRVAPGRPVARGDTLVEVMTDKATVEISSPFSGAVTDLRAAPGQVIPVGDVLLTYESAETPAAQPLPPAPPAGPCIAPRLAVIEDSPAPVPPPETGRVRAAPAVRLLARQLGIDLRHVRGTGPDGRIVLSDLAVAAPPSPLDSRARRGLPDLGAPGTRVSLRGIRRESAERLARSAREVPQFSYIDECDLTDLVRLRQSLRDPLRQSGVKLTYLPFLIKAAAAALRDVPLVNASLDEPAGEVILHANCHIGVAVSTPLGLVVPVIHDADAKDLTQVARDVARLADEARAGRCRRDDLQGATFTVTSVGHVGGLMATPLVSPPQVGIVALGRIVRRPVYDDAGTLHPAELAYLSFSFDHRVVDGLVAATFANAILDRLRSPAQLLLPDLLPGTPSARSRPA